MLDAKDGGKPLLEPLLRETRREAQTIRRVGEGDVEGVGLERRHKAQGVGAMDYGRCTRA